MLPLAEEAVVNLKNALAVALAMGLGRLTLEALDRRRALKLSGAAVVVCGASRGLGRALVLELARRGVAKIAICARKEHDLDSLVATLVAKGVFVCAEQCDLSKEEEVERFIGTATAR